MSAAQCQLGPPNHFASLELERYLTYTARVNLQPASHIVASRSAHSISARNPIHTQERAPGSDFVGSERQRALPKATRTTSHNLTVGPDVPVRIPHALPPARRTTPG
ncbi:hypothetical protein FKP32DRAFT_1590678 [Trametes sanguinea]|nr:hypothetical protein FKP32DRAFT_1590678 [Trametes sanguinea]